MTSRKRIFNIFVCSDCGNNCPKCSQKYLRRDRFSASKDQIRKIVDVVGKSKIVGRFDVRLTGGDPLRWENLCWATKYMKNSGVFNKLQIITSLDNLENIDKHILLDFNLIRISNYKHVSDTNLDIVMDLFNIKKGKCAYTLDNTVIKIHNIDVEKDHYGIPDEPVDYSGEDCLCKMLFCYNDYLYPCPNIISLSRYLGDNEYAKSVRLPLNEENIIKMYSINTTKYCGYCWSNRKVNQIMRNKK